jgi:hypothetical protein
MMIIGSIGKTKWEKAMILFRQDIPFLGVRFTEHRTPTVKNENGMRAREIDIHSQVTDLILKRSK